MKHWVRPLIAALLVPLALAACMFMPGKFESSLNIRADRSFTFAYKGEVLALDLKRLASKAMAAGMEQGMKEDAKRKKGKKDSSADELPDLTLTPEEKARRDVEYRTLATQLAKEAGYRTVEYRGEGVFYVDYAIAGKLSHNFTFPYNQDAEMVFPFVVVELRGKDGVRVKAPGFAKQQQSGMGGLGAMGAMGEGMGEGVGEALGLNTGAKMDGIFTLTTDAEIVSQNNEEGATTTGAGKTISWKVTGSTEAAPMAMLKVSGL